MKKLSELTPAVNELISRSNRLGVDPKVTNYAGGNTSAKATITDPISGKPTSLLFVKGSGGDLGTLKEEGIAVLYTDKVHELKNVYLGEHREDEMVALFDYCLFGKGGAAPSIDTSMHGLVDKLHVDHLHPDSIIAFATSADGPAITKKCFGDEILWVDWRRPGFQLGLDIAKIAAENPNAKGCILGGHGLTTWADTSDECEKRSLDAIKKAEDFIKANGKAEPFGSSIAKYKALPEVERRARAAQLSPILRGVASQDARMVGHFTDSNVVLDFIASQSLQKLAALGTSCPDHFLRTKVSPMVLDTEPSADLEQVITRIHTLHEEYRANYSAYYNHHATKESPAIRGADPLIILVPGIGMFSYGKDKQTARVAGEFYVNAINVMRGAEALSTYAPISELEKFRIEYWDLEEAKLRRMPKPKALAGQIALVTGGASGIGRAIVQRYFDEGACVAIADRDLEGAKKLIAEMGNPERLLAVGVDVTLEDQVAAAVNATTLAFGGIDILVNNAGLSLSKSLVDTTVSDWDLQHNVMARGSFLFSREVAKAMIVQKMAGNILYIASKNAVFAGPNNVAYGATKADQAHQVRLLAAELGEYGIRVNGINPDGVVQGSGIFASGWGANRAAVYGVEEEKLGAFYAQRSILKLEVLPSHIAAAAFAFVAGDLPLTTGSHIPVDSGVASAFLR
ncbi:MAG: bifunctional rhamnulose-1-phosphate aldolase/short-chain dehydrogenase [Actinobacteria bacterium]|nr:MAG: bifunctional rhamnulose-1-phosphate aldolase/short-chain dehydrogenase [Actinomycetota bacterium]